MTMNFLKCVNIQETLKLFIREKEEKQRNNVVNCIGPLK